MYLISIARTPDSLCEEEGEIMCNTVIYFKKSGTRITTAGMVRCGGKKAVLHVVNNLINESEKMIAKCKINAEEYIEKHEDVIGSLNGTLAIKKKYLSKEI